MIMRNKKECTVVEADNGWIFEWSDPPEHEQSYVSVGFQIPKKTWGRQVFTDERKLHSEIKRFLGIGK